jgi:outer membrane lipoprotein-sorting protein
MRTRRILKSFATAGVICAALTTCIVSLSASSPQSHAENGKQNTGTASDTMHHFRFGEDCSLSGLTNSFRSAQDQNPATNKSEGGLEEVLHRMDQTAANFHTAQADFVWKNYTSVVDTFSDPQNGKIYFRRSANQTEMAADLLPPSARQIIFSNGKVRIYTPGTGEVQEYDASAHREEFETFLVLGFGSGGSDLHKSFDVTYRGRENINGADTDKLELVPTSASIKARFPKIVLWINSDGVSQRQQLFEQNDDYRLADYSNIKLNKNLPKDAFKLKTSGKVKSVSH